MVFIEAWRGQTGHQMAGMEIIGPHEETPGWPFSMEGRKREAPLVFFCFFWLGLAAPTVGS